MQQRKFYFAMIGTFAFLRSGGDDWVLRRTADRLHLELKVAYGINSTTKLSDQDWTDYIDFCLMIYREVFGIYFDCDWRKYENVRYHKMDNYRIDLFT